MTSGGIHVPAFLSFLVYIGRRLGVWGVGWGGLPLALLGRTEESEQDVRYAQRMTEAL